MSNITFTEIPNTNGHISKFGYRLVGNHEFSEDVRQTVGVNLMDDWIDSLADGFGSIYQGSDGNLYLVHFCYWFDEPVPACWWRVEKEV